MQNEIEDLINSLIIPYDNEQEDEYLYGAIEINNCKEAEQEQDYINSMIGRC